MNPVEEWSMIGRGLRASFIPVSSLCIRGWAVQLLWGWFVVPMGFDHLGYAQSVGILLLGSLFRARPRMAAWAEADPFFIMMGSLFWPLGVVAIAAVAGGK